MKLDAPIPRAALAAGALLGAALAFAASIVWVRDPDLFHHLAYGRLVASAGFPATEPFTWPLAGTPVGPFPYWLGSVAIWGWHVAFGEGGLAFLPAAAAAVLVLVLLADSAPRGGRHSVLTVAAAALPIVLAMAMFRLRAAARPDTLVLPLLAATALAVRRFEEGRPRLLLAWPLLVVLWTNLHASAIAGVALVALLVAVAGARAVVRPAERSRELALAAGVLLAGASATLATPASNPAAVAVGFVGSLLGRGVSGAEAAAPAAGASTAYLLIDELAPPTLAALSTPPGLLLVLTLVSFVLRGRAARIREVVTVAAFTVLAAGAVRFAAVLAVVCAPVAARNLGEAVRALPGALGRVRTPALAATALALLAAAYPLVLPAIHRQPPQVSFGTGLWPAAYPVRGADYLARIGFGGRLYNAFGFGAYLSWRGLPAYQDGRGPPPGAELASMAGPVSPDFGALDARWRFDALLLSYPELSPEYEAVVRAAKGDEDWLVERGTWALVAFDDGGALYLRRDGRYAERAAQDEYRFARPGNAGATVSRSTLPHLLAEYRRSAEEAPGCLRCRALLAEVAFAAGDLPQAASAIAPVLERAERQHPGLLPLAAEIAEATGDAARARALYRGFLARGDDPAARRGLARLELASGDAAAAEAALAPNLAAGAPSAADLELGLAIARARGRPGDAAALEAARGRASSAAMVQQHFQQAIAAERRGDLAGAIASWEACLAISESNAAVHSNLGFVLQKAGRVDDAVRAQRRAIELSPALANAHYGLGAALARRGDRAGAIAAFERYLALEPHGYWAARATEIVTELRRR